MLNVERLLKFTLSLFSNYPNATAIASDGGRITVDAAREGITKQI
jgi:hypothetical protein